MKKIFAVVFVVLVVLGCKTKPASEASEVPVSWPKAPAFNPDSAYAFIQKQVDFGPRIVNSAAHKACGNYLVAKLKGYGWQVTEQNFTTEKYDGTKLQARNIFAAFNPAATKRILLASHWDSRTQSDKDPNNKKGRYPSANDGPSGVGVLLEIARTLSQDPSKLNIGVDIILFDAEDDGEPEDSEAVPTRNGLDTWWCLGSQYWAKNPHTPGYTAYFGILLDMVGAGDAVFSKDTYSTQFAGSILNNVWAVGQKLGYGKHFVDDEGVGITDDHVFVNRDAKIPMIDILDYRPKSEKGFGPYHHTQSDNMSVIDKNTLKAVGETLMQVLANESAGI